MKLASKKAAARVRGLIRKARKDSTFAEISAKTGVSERTLRYWETGNTRPTKALCAQATERLSA